MQLPFQRVQEQFIKEKTTKDDHQYAPQCICVRVEFCETLYKSHIQQHQQGEEDHKSKGHFFISGIAQRTGENVGVENKFQGSRNIIEQEFL